MSSVWSKQSRNHIAIMKLLNCFNVVFMCSMRSIHIQRSSETFSLCNAHSGKLLLTFIVLYLNFMMRSIPNCFGELRLNLMCFIIKLYWEIHTKTPTWFTMFPSSLSRAPRAPTSRNRNGYHGYGSGSGRNVIVIMLSITETVTMVMVQFRVAALL